ncbi:phosphotransferase [Mycoplasmopsis primatum]|uniref:phosphotransferase n=1 Tax=Mycoplasmopsis primatum TaxID=55604 RepID=UPI000496A16C|nr:phosphotransferase [Mycoplasmopsis primatum]
MNDKKKMITKGLTNVSYSIGNKFIQEKKYTGFNHKIDYKILSQFSFVPKLLFNDEFKTEWEFIHGIEPDSSDENLIKLAKCLKVLHNSKAKFPPSNHAARVKEYRKILKEKNININVLNDFYKNVNLTLSKMQKDTPCHNDLWARNFVLQEGTKKLYLCDWEYASLGDKHFDLAYFIESSNLNSHQEKVFLDAYGEYNYLYILRQKILVNYLIILWVNCQLIKYFETIDYENNIYKYAKELEKYKN